MCVCGGLRDGLLAMARLTDEKVYAPILVSSGANWHKLMRTFKTRCKVGRKEMNAADK